MEMNLFLKRMRDDTLVLERDSPPCTARQWAHGGSRIRKWKEGSSWITLMELRIALLLPFRISFLSCGYRLPAWFP